MDLQLVRAVPPAYFSSRVETVELEFAGDNCKCPNSTPDPNPKPYPYP